MYLFVVFYDEAVKRQIRQLNDEQRIHAKQAAHGIEDFFSTWTGILESFSKMEPIISVDPEGKQNMALFYEAHQEQIRSITRVDENGFILHTVPYSSSIGTNISGQQHMREILRNHRPVVSGVFKTVQGFDAVALHVPVFKEGTFKGTIAIVLDFANLAKRYFEVIKVGKSGTAWVVSRDGTILYSVIPGFTGKSVLDSFKDSPTILAMTKDMLKGNAGTAIYTLEKTGEMPVKKYAIYMPIHIANSFWSVVVASSENEVLSSLTSFRNRLILVISLMILGGVLFSLITVKAWRTVAEEQKHSQDALRRSLQEVISAKKDLEGANARLKELDRLKSLFIASMSHELRTPLNSIIGFTGILLQGLAGELNAEQRKQLGMVKSSSEHLLSLITDIIDLSKIEAGKIDLRLESFELAAIVSEVLCSFQNAAQRKGLSLLAEVPPGIAIMSDKRRIRQVLMNLVGNALKFTEHGNVRVIGQQKNGVMEVSVCDTGIGIKGEDLGKLFKTFSQVTTAEAPKHEGTGLGLYLSRKLITLLGGEIRVESEFGSGSVFSFTVPARQ